MESIAKEYEVSLDTIADNIHWVERTLLNADILQTSVTCVYKTNIVMTLRENAGLYFLQGENWKSGNCRSHVVLAAQLVKNENCVFCTDAVCTLNFSERIVK